MKCVVRPGSQDGLCTAKGSVSSCAVHSLVDLSTPIPTSCGVGTQSMARFEANPCKALCTCVLTNHLDTTQGNMCISGVVTEARCSLQSAHKIVARVFAKFCFVNIIPLEKGKIVISDSETQLEVRLNKTSKEVTFCPVPLGETMPSRRAGILSFLRRVLP